MPVRRTVRSASGAPTTRATSSPKPIAGDGERGQRYAGRHGHREPKWIHDYYSREWELSNDALADLVENWLRDR